ncbi:lytic transglycosylase domain-containing protein [Catenuloplanes sp. NPDC051500]|uniref:aggregation-promoting factor C-terminal-like domain-containing protein n=1 Tax=Catenuloplanes sp. NPDC051500 TaxID=3363959 RepID=UPI00378DE64E
MNSLVGRYGVRSAAVAMLMAGVGGGVYLSQDRAHADDSAAAQAAWEANRAEELYLKDRHRQYAELTASLHDSSRDAAARAAKTAEDEAKRARTANDAVTRKKKAQQAEAAAAAEEKDKANAALKPYDGPVPSSCASYSGHRKTGCSVMVGQGFAVSEFGCLDKLWTRESGWNPKAQNPSTPAYGIPQANPGSKMASVADDWQTNPATQVIWGLGYIKGRYSTPCAALTHSNNSGWY